MARRHAIFGVRRPSSRFTSNRAKPVSVSQVVSPPVGVPGPTLKFNVKSDSQYIPVIGA